MVNVVHINISGRKLSFPALIQPQMKVQIPQVIIPMIPCTAPAF